MRIRKWLILALCAPQAVVFLPCQQSTVREAYVFSATHFDLNFTGPPPFSFARNHRVLDAALKLSEEQPGFRYVIENLYLFNQYLRTHPEKLAPFAAGVRAGKFELAAQWSDLLQNLVTGEDLSRNILLAREFAKNYLSADVRVQSLSDVPGQMGQAATDPPAVRPGRTELSAGLGPVTLLCLSGWALMERSCASHPCRFPTREAISSAWANHSKRWKAQSWPSLN